ncbi:MAG: YchJ family metal-binding protein, partial [Marmoricola sp.]
FRAHFEERGRSGVLQERSRFAERAGRWFYLDGEVVLRPEARATRPDPDSS